jgi:hypothetical protein
VKIINRTHWQTRDVRAVLAKVAEMELDPDHRRHVVITLEPGRSGNYPGGVSGHAGLGKIGEYRRHRIQLRLPPREIDPISLAATTAHEMAHLRGIDHKAMRGAPRYTYAPGWREVWAWAEPYPIRKMAPRRALTKLDRWATKTLKAERMVKLWETRAKRAETYLRKWRRRHARLVRAETQAAQSVPVLTAHATHDIGGPS